MPLCQFNFAILLKMLSSLGDCDHHQVSLFINEEMSGQRQNSHYRSWYKRKVFLNSRRCITSLFFALLITDMLVYIGKKIFVQVSSGTALKQTLLCYEEKRQPHTRRNQLWEWDLREDTEDQRAPRLNVKTGEVCCCWGFPYGFLISGHYCCKTIHCNVDVSTAYI